MGYNDLKIAIKRRKKLQQREQPTEQEYEFEPFRAGEALEFDLPAGSAKAEEPFIKRRYPHLTRPAVVFCMPGDPAADILFQEGEERTAGENGARAEKEAVRDMIMRRHPANPFYGEGVEDAGRMKVEWFDFDSFGLDGMIYNLMFFTSVRGRLCSGSFHCESSRAAAWKPVILKTFQSFREWEDKYEG